MTEEGFIRIRPAVDDRIEFKSQNYVQEDNQEGSQTD